MGQARQPPAAASAPRPSQTAAERQRVQRPYCATHRQLLMTSTHPTFIQPQTIHPPFTRFPSPRPRLFKKGECQADGCAADLSGLPRYHQRNHIW